MRLWASSFILRLVFFFLPIEIPPEKEKPLLQSLAGAAFCCISPLHNEPQPEYPALRSLTPHSSDAPSPHTLTLPGEKKNINVIGGRCWQCMPGRKEKEKKVSLPLPPPKLRLCQVTTNRKGRIKTQPPRPPPSTQLKLHGCQLPLTNNYTARLLGHILPGGPSSRKAQLRKPGCDAWGS